MSGSPSTLPCSQARCSTPADAPSFDGQPLSDDDSCRDMGGRVDGGNCYDYYGKRIYP